MAPLMLLKLKDEEIQDIISNGTENSVQLTSLTWHMQAVERCMKLIIEVSFSVIVFNAKNGLIKRKLQSWGLIP